jgi:hypothetical protein
LSAAGERNLSAFTCLWTMGKPRFRPVSGAPGDVLRRKGPARDVLVRRNFLNLSARQAYSVQLTNGSDGVDQLHLTDFDVDQQLLSLGGTSLLIFTSLGCSSCRWARDHLPQLDLPINRLCWIDAEENGGAVQRYGVFHLPALFVIRDGDFFGPLRSTLLVDDLRQGLDRALGLAPDELP